MLYPDFKLRYAILAAGLYTSVEKIDLFLFPAEFVHFFWKRLIYHCFWERLVYSCFQRSWRAVQTTRRRCTLSWTRLALTARDIDSDTPLFSSVLGKICSFLLLAHSRLSCCIIIIWQYLSALAGLEETRDELVIKLVRKLQGVIFYTFLYNLIVPILQSFSSFDNWLFPYLQRWGPEKSAWLRVWQKERPAWVDQGWLVIFIIILIFDQGYFHDHPCDLFSSFFIQFG